MVRITKNIVELTTVTSVLVAIIIGILAIQASDNATLAIEKSNQLIEQSIILLNETKRV